MPLTAIPLKRVKLKFDCMASTHQNIGRHARTVLANNNACGKLARDALSKLIRGQNVACKIIDRDRYGRQVSACKQGTLDINREMVRLGWAIAYRRHAHNYVAAEREAKAAKRGIWAWTFEMPEDYRARNRTVQGSAVDFDFKDE